MPSNNYFPTSYNYPSYQLYQQPQPGIQWVHGEAEAKAYPVPAGSSALLMDMNAEMFYIKSVDASGMPQPLRVYEYTEVVTAPDPQVDMGNYATKEDIAAINRRLDGLTRGRKKDE